MPPSQTAELGNTRGEEPDRRTAGPPKPDTVTRSALPGVVGDDRAERRLSATVLRSELLAFADRYLEAVAEAADAGADHAGSPKTRAAFRQIKVIYITGAVTTVTEPDPLRVLRDLMVLLRLQVLVWEAGGHHKWAEADASAVMLAALRDLESQLLLLAGRVFPTEAIDLIHEATAQWRRANPDRRYVAFARFSDLADSDLRQRFESHAPTQGFLAPVEQAREELQELRGVAERALFLVNHMPLLVEWQAEALVFNTLKQPEVRQILADVDRVAVTAETLAGEVARLPARVAAERKAALDQFAGLAGQLEGRVVADLRGEREALLRQLAAVSGDLLPLSEQFARIAADSREVMTLATALRGDGRGGDFRLEDARELVLAARQTSLELTTLVNALSNLLGDDTGAAALVALDERLAAHTRRLFLYAAALLVLAGVVVFVCVLLLRRPARGAA